MRLGLPSLVFERESMPDIRGLGVDLSKIPTVNPTSIKRIPQAAPVTPPPLPSPELVEQYNQLAPSTSLIEQAVQEALENLPVMMGGVTSADLGPLGTSGISIMEEGPITMASDSPSPMSLMVEPEVTPMDSDIDRMIEKAVASAVASGGDMPIQAADDPIPTIASVQEAVAAAEANKPVKPVVEKELAEFDPVQAAVEAAVGNGQPTTDDTILDPDDMVVGATIVTPYYNPATGETFTQYNTAQPVPEGFIPGSPPETPAQPDFMAQLQELITQMQAEQTAAAEQAAAAEQQRQEQVAAMTQNYMVGQPAVGYNPYESGQYQSDPYGAAGVPAMGGITTIPVPAAYNPNPYPIGGTT
tara:strand:+ start:270 stop:1343 length:1074 start_codon:yes stop_codon:yes gene_type:complete